MKETPLVKQYRSIKAQYPETLLFFRLGDFYELFDEDAVEASKLMEVALTKRQGRPMCGVPYHAASNYIRKILSKSRSVAVCEQVEDPSRAKGIVKREVVRVITPGTVIEDDLLSEGSNNFLVSLAPCGENVYGLVFLDVSTGDFTGCRASSLQLLESEISRMPVSEAVLPESAGALEEFISTRFPGLPHTAVDDWHFTQEKSRDAVKGYFGLSTLKGWGLDREDAVSSACGGLVRYLEKTQKDRRVQFKKFRLYRLEEGMMLDRKVQENLELVRNQQDGSKKNTLFSTLDFTETAMGRRLLVNWVLRPLTDVKAIGRRLDAVEEILSTPELMGRVISSLSGISDMERIMARASFGTCNARDLIGLRETLKKIPELKKALSGVKAAALKKIRKDLDPLEEVAEELDSALRDSPPLTVKEGNIIKKGYSSELDELIEIASGDKNWISSLESTERKRLDIPSLKVGYNKVYGYYIEVTKVHTDKVPENYERKQTLVNSERYITEELKRREDSILGAEERKAALEYRLFTSLREKVSLRSHVIQENSGLISELDVLNSFAAAAARHGYRRPSVSGGGNILIKEGRHPVVEASMGVSGFIPNDTELDGKENRILVITGPNMSGKSTYLKQVALITVMAQAGSFVPASEARIGVADRIFTRIGAGENLAQGESTFMVEMTEVASILSGATSRSLLIMDEVGRGTSTFDGISIAWAVIEELSRMGARTLFATHYFELTGLPSRLEGVKNYNFAVREWADRRKIVFLRKLQRGSADKSYGIHCAQLAGVPPEVIKRAWDIFNSLEEKEPSALPPREREKSGPDQLSFLDDSALRCRDMISSLDLNSLTPLDLMQVVRKWQEDIKDEDRDIT